MGSFFFHFSFNLLLLFFSVFLVTSSFATNESDGTLLTLKVVDIDLSPSLRCERIQVSGVSRWKLWGHPETLLGSYFNFYRVTLVPSVAIPEKLHNKIKVCFHKNNTLEWCQCKEDEWKSVEKGMWGAIMSPYVTRYADIKIDVELSGSVTFSVKEDSTYWLLRFCALYFGTLLMLFAFADYRPLNKQIFLKWTFLGIGTSLVFQSTFDTPLAFGTVVFWVAYCKYFSSKEKNRNRRKQLRRFIMKQKQKQLRRGQ
ncbi:hypothetical protein P8452_50220 [Trifolium repens]|nr:hypothetical protein P8452_50220 [Trifolium repens]